MTRVSYDVLVDRRTDALEDVRDEIRSLVDSVRDLEVVWETEDAVENARDAARFRDFARVASLTHPDERGLEWVVEELVETFGWKVDVSRREVEESE